MAMSKSSKPKSKTSKRYNRKKTFRKKRSTVLARADVASVKVLQNSFPIQANTLYAADNFSLTNNVRPMQVAKSYQYYRVKKVIMKWTPYYDTFQPGTSTNLCIPQLYYMIDKTGDIPVNATINDLKKMGAKPHRFDDKNVTASFAPAILNSSNEVVGTIAPVFAGQSIVSPWLPTNQNAAQNTTWQANSVDHRGIKFYVQAANFGTNTIGEMQVEIHFEFKKPFWTNSTSEVEFTKIDVDELGKDTDYIPPVLEV